MKNHGVHSMNTKRRDNEAKADEFATALRQAAEMGRGQEKIDVPQLSAVGKEAMLLVEYRVGALLSSGSLHHGPRPAIVSNVRQDGPAPHLQPRRKDRKS